MRRRELKIARSLQDCTEDHQYACESALLIAMILAQSGASSLDGDEKTMGDEKHSERMKAKMGMGVSVSSPRLAGKHLVCWKRRS